MFQTTCFKILKEPSRVTFFVSDLNAADSIKFIKIARPSEVGSLRIAALRRTHQKFVKFTLYLQNVDNNIELIQFLNADCANCVKYIKALSSETIILNMNIVLFAKNRFQDKMP